MSRFIIRYACACVLLLAGTRSSHATWSICIANLETREVAVGTVTCLTNFDLLAIVPVIVVERGAAAVQSAGDFQGIRRPIIFQEFMNGTPPEEILNILSGIGGHQQRQYGIVDTQQRGVTFTGASNGQWAGGRTFTIGSTIYAIQGNVLAGQCVIDAIDDAIHDVVKTTGGDIPEQLMAGMEAAAAMGGDGRCSCSPNNPPACGCPVEQFTKSGHIGGMVVARVDDVDDTVCNASGCVDGDYLMRLNVAFQNTNRPDPVVQLREQFDAWRADHEGRPDAVHSTAAFAPAFIPPNGVSVTTLSITLLDWRDLPVDAAIESLTVEHAAGSAGISTIGKVLDNGDGTFDVMMTAGTTTGVDRFRVLADDGVRPVTLTPEPRLEYFSLGDVDGNGAVDFGDLLALLAAWGACPEPPEPCPADVDGNGVVNFADLLLLLGNWTT